VLKKTITYTDFNGEEVSEDFFFHLSKAELVELELSHSGGLSSALERIVAAQDGKSIIAEFKNIILGAYGKRSDDGRRFMKNQEIRDEFESSEAYSVLFMELVTDASAAAEFINGIIPEGMAEEVAKLVPEEEKDTQEQGNNLQELRAVKPDPELIHKHDIARMSADELEILGARLLSGEAKLAE